MPRMFVSAFVTFPVRNHGRFRFQSKSSGVVTQPPTVCLRMTHDDSDNVVVPAFIQSTVLQQVFPALIKWKDTYGHPNIPLGTPDGRMCQTLRRFEIQQKLTQDEVQLLKYIGFRFSSLEDVYHELDFDVMLEKLISYEHREQTNYQIPKKYAPDPELGAWVTGIRRVNKAEGRDEIDPNHRQRLDEIGFSWVSERKCGSKFMMQYRQLQAQLMEESSDESRNAILQQDKVQQWIAAQRENQRRGKLSDTRFHYLQQLLGDDWMDSSVVGGVCQ